MPANARHDYLVTEVMTATPQKLQLMLIEAALRFAAQARQQWDNGRLNEAGESLVRCQQIVTELLCGLNQQADPDLVRRVAGVYLFVFRCLTTAQIEHSEEKLAEAVSILELERETWQMVCDTHGSKQDTAGQTPPALDRMLEA